MVVGDTYDQGEGLDIRGMPFGDLGKIFPVLERDRTATNLNLYSGSVPAHQQKKLISAVRVQGPETFQPCDPRERELKPISTIAKGTDPAERNVFNEYGNDYAYLDGLAREALPA